MKAPPRRCLPEEPTSWSTSAPVWRIQRSSSTPRRSKAFPASAGASGKGWSSAPAPPSMRFSKTADSPPLSAAHRLRPRSRLLSDPQSRHRRRQRRQRFALRGHGAGAVVLASPRRDRLEAGRARNSVQRILQGRQADRRRQRRSGRAHRRSRRGGGRARRLLQAQADQRPRSRHRQRRAVHRTRRRNAPDHRLVRPDPGADRGARRVRSPRTRWSPRSWGRSARSATSGRRANIACIWSKATSGAFSTRSGHEDQRHDQRRSLRTRSAGKHHAAPLSARIRRPHGDEGRVRGRRMRRLHRVARRPGGEFLPGSGGGGRRQVGAHDRGRNARRQALARSRRRSPSATPSSAVSAPPAW